MISEAMPVQCRLARRLCYPRSVINAMTISNAQQQTIRLRDVAWSQKPHASRDTKPALMQADQRERALIVGDREEIFFGLLALAVLAEGVSPALLNARGPVPEPPEGAPPRQGR
jgi:hypothetical protein